MGKRERAGHYEQIQRGKLRLKPPPEGHNKGDGHKEQTRQGDQDPDRGHRGKQAGARIDGRGRIQGLKGFPLLQQRSRAASKEGENDDQRSDHRGDQPDRKGRLELRSRPGLSEKLR